MESMVVATLDATSQIGTSLMVGSPTNLGARSVRRLFSDESRFCLKHQDGCIRVWRHRGKRTLAACIRHRHNSPSPGVMV
ncbi:hypothetical protein TNCV_567051 [Trichonephila clavipes]|nr:hypothetical protein TNCV_567051 [Trichonephila clavipes]